MNIDLHDQVAVVTGGSRGIGAACARALGASGAHVVVNYRQGADAAAGVVDEIRAHGGSAEALQFDVVDEAAVKSAMKELGRRHGRIDVLVNNAGVSRDGLLLRVKTQDIEDILSTNLKGAYFCAMHAARFMLKQKSGRIVNMSSIVGLEGNAGQSVYAMSKAGLVGLTKSLAKELGPKGILVNAVAPGLIETEMTAALDHEALAAQIPLRRMGVPEEVAGTVVFLCSGLAAYMTGQVLVVDGGLHV